MTECVAMIAWKRNGATFTDNKYSRAHQWRFDGGAVVPGSSSPHVVRVPLSDRKRSGSGGGVRRSLSSCHMLWFLSIAASMDSSSTVIRIRRSAPGRKRLGQARDDGVTLRPKVTFAGREPSRTELESMHHQAHEECFIAYRSKPRCDACPE